MLLLKGDMISNGWRVGWSCGFVKEIKEGMLNFHGWFRKGVLVG